MIQHSCQAICACCGRRCNLLVDGHSTHRRAGGHEFTKLAAADQVSFPRTAELDRQTYRATEPVIDIAPEYEQRRKLNRESAARIAARAPLRAAQKRERRAAAKATDATDTTEQGESHG